MCSPHAGAGVRTSKGNWDDLMGFPNWRIFPSTLDHVFEEEFRQVSERNHVHLDHLELRHPINILECTKRTEPCIVDDGIRAFRDKS